MLLNCLVIVMPWTSAVGMSMGTPYKPCGNYYIWNVVHIKMASLQNFSRFHHIQYSVFRVIRISRVYIVGQRDYYSLTWLHLKKITKTSGYVTYIRHNNILVPVSMVRYVYLVVGIELLHYRNRYVNGGYVWLAASTKYTYPSIWR